MKTLYLVRHAKSDKGNLALKDIDRPLNDRGYKDAYFMGELMRRERYTPDILITSPAVRAYSTAVIFLKTFGFSDRKLQLNDMLYEESSSIFISEVKAIPDEISSAMVFAHNPTITEVAGSLAEKPIPGFPTTGIACLDFEVKSWGEISEKTGRLRFFEFPKNHVL